MKIFNVQHRNHGSVRSVKKVRGYFTLLLFGYSTEKSTYWYEK